MILFFSCRAAGSLLDHVSSGFLLVATSPGQTKSPTPIRTNGVKSGTAGCLIALLMTAWALLFPLPRGNP